MIICFKNAKVFQTKGIVSIEDNLDVIVENDLIKDVGQGISSSYAVDKTIDCKGKILMPGNVCSHHHYYSGLSRGMQISAGKQEDFIQVLKEWWWRLDRGLDEEACYYSSLICSLDAIKAGTTSVVDHHASPNYIKGSLSTIAKGMSEVGLRGVTCYEVTNRNGGEKENDEGIAENIRFAKEVDAKVEKGEKVLCEAMIGGHAPFTISDYGMGKLKEAMDETNRGLHLHIAEDDYDVKQSHHIYGLDIVDRLNKFNLLTDKSMLVHGIFLSDYEVDLINSNNCFFAHNSRSNMNNHVGYCPHITKLNKLVLGTDGCGGDMFEEIKLAFFKHRDSGGPFWPSDYLNALTRGNTLVETAYNNRFKLGRIEKGYKADLVVLQYNSPTPLLDVNAATHFVWGMSSNMVETVMVDGAIVMENRQIGHVDVDKIYKEAARVSESLWKKVDKIKA